MSKRADEERGDRLAAMRRSAGLVLAEAVTRLYPGTKIASGSSIENGFYSDFALPRPLTTDDLPAIEAEMRRAIDEGRGCSSVVVTAEEARRRFADEPYELELIEGRAAEAEVALRVLTDADGGALLSVPASEGGASHEGKIDRDAFRLTAVAGAYWRGDENRPMLTRIYGTAWETAEELAAHLAFLEEAEKRDHRRLGADLDLFSFHEDAGPGLVYWHPNGGRVRVAIENYWRAAHYRSGYEILFTPHIGKAWLWETSGHLGFYRENMYAPMQIDAQDYYLKPMNCPFHILIYKSKGRSYRDLPLRWAELGTVYRYEKSGSLHGSLRVRGFTQDDAHIICTPEQVEGEILEALRFSLRMWRTFGFTDITAYLATRPADAVGEGERWEAAQASLRKAIDAESLAYEVDEGGGAFYGPKIDLKVTDALAREWQMSTIQFDFTLPERFDMTYVDADGGRKRPYMVHRALLGSLERFFGVLVEHYGGAFPVWLAPEQVAVIPVAGDYDDYAKRVADALRARDLRVSVELAEGRLNARIRDCQNRKIPYMAIVGKKEQEDGTVSVRLRDGRQLPAMGVEDFIAYADEKVRGQSLDL